MATSAHADVWDRKPFTTSAAQLRAAADKVPVKDSPPAIRLVESKYVRYDDQGRATVRLHRIYKVTSAEGVRGWANTGATWSPWYQARPTIRARVIDPSGKVHKFDPSTLIEDKAPTGSDHIYSDTKKVRAPLPSVAIGSVIEEQITWRQTGRYFKAASAESFYFYSSATWVRAKFVVDVPTKLRPRGYDWGVANLRKSVKKRGGRTVFTYQASNLPKWERPKPYLPADVKRYPRAVVSIGSFRAMADEYRKVIDKAIAAGPVPSLIAQLRGQKHGSRRAKIAAALALVSDNIRYTGLELGESAIVPFTPAETWKRKYGDCKDKATLLVSLLRGIGIGAHVALIKSSFGQNIHRKAASPGAFNHVIVAVPEGRKILWIDPTQELAAVGELPQSDQNRLALIARKGERKLTRTPVLPGSANVKREVRTVKIPEIGKAAITELATFSGAPAIDFRQYLRDRKTTDIKEGLETYVDNEYNEAKLGPYSFTKPADVRTPLEFRMDMTGAKIAVMNRNEGSLYIDVTRVYDEIPKMFRGKIDDKADKDDKRKHDALLWPVRREILWHLDLPEGVTVPSLPPNSTERIGPATLAVSFRSSGRRVTARWMLDLGSGRFKASELRQLRQRMHRPGTREINIEFSTKAQQLVAVDKLGEAADELRRMQRRHPTHAIHHVQLAELYGKVGIMRAAVQQALRATKLDPKLADAHGILGYLYSQGNYGRWAKDSAKWAKAVAAERKAVKLDPSAVWIAQNLALTLEHNKRWKRYDGDLDKAIAVYKSIPFDQLGPDWRTNYYTAIVRAGRWKDGLVVGKKAESDAARGLRIASAAVLGGEARALREITGVASKSDRAAALPIAFLHLMNAREYGALAALFQAVKKNGDLAAGGQNSIDMIRLLRRYDPKKLASRRLEDIPLQFIGAIFDPALSKRLAPTMDRSEFEKGSGHAAFSVLSSGFALDMFDSLTTQKREQLRGWGWRIEVLMGKYMGDRKLSLFVRRVGGRYRLVAFGEELESLTSAALDFAKRGKLDAARKLLDWLAREDNAPLLLSRLWKVSQQADRATAVAVAAAIQGKKRAAEGIRLLGECKAIDASRRIWCHRSVWLMAASVRDAAAGISALERAIALEPHDEMQKHQLVRLFEAAGRTADADRLVAQLGANGGRDDKLTQLRAGLAAVRGDFAQSVKIYKELVARGGANDSVNNELAWNSLFLGRPDEAALSAAKATAKSKASSSYNTLAAVRARRGELSAAYAAFEQSIEGRAVDGPQDFLVLGRIAETLGLTAEARRFYKKSIAANKDKQPAASGQLAKKWLKQLK